jgi:hypothetical protein
LCDSGGQGQLATTGGSLKTSESIGHLIGGLEHFPFFHILGIIIPTDIVMTTKLKSCLCSMSIKRKVKQPTFSGIKNISKTNKKLEAKTYCHFAIMSSNKIVII